MSVTVHSTGVLWKKTFGWDGESVRWELSFWGFAKP